MNTLSTILHFAASHKLLTLGAIGLTGATGYAAYKLVNKGIDAIQEIIDRAIDRGYSLDSQKVKVNPYPQYTYQVLPIRSN